MENGSDHLFIVSSSSLCTVLHILYIIIIKSMGQDAYLLYLPVASKAMVYRRNASFPNFLKNEQAQSHILNLVNG